MTKLFTLTELKLLKYKLIKKGYSEAQAEKEIENMMECAEKNHEKYLTEEKRKKQKEKRYKKGRFKEEFRRLKNG